MKISDATLAWTPDRPEYSAGMRGKCRLFPATAGEADIAPFACKAGRFDARAQDQRSEVREAYVMMVALMMSQRDGLDVGSVHRFFLEHIDEYREACAPELLEAHSRTF